MTRPEDIQRQVDETKEAEAKRKQSNGEGMVLPKAGLSGQNVLSKNVEIQGTVSFVNELVVDGKIEGEIVSDGALTVGENADIQGDITTRSVTVLGKVSGNVVVRERCELKAQAHLVGNVKAGRLVIEEGATFVGSSEVSTTPGRTPIQATT